MKRNSHCLFTLLALVWLMPAQAGVYVVCQGINVCTVTPARISFGQAGTTTIRWQMDVDFTGVPAIPIGGPVPVLSTQMTISDGASILATINRPLSFTAPNGGSGSGVITESVLIPRYVTEQAVRNGATSLFLTRTFTDGQAADTGTVVVTIGSSAGGVLSISRLRLAFDDDAPVRLVARGESLSANIEIESAGSGLMRGYWELSGPASNSGEAIFRPILTVQQYLAGSARHSIASPTLPTDVDGLYLLRFRMIEPVTALEVPTVRYFVGTGAQGERLPAASIALLSPVDGEVLAPETTFSWHATQGARAYQLEIYSRPESLKDTLPNLGTDLDNATANVLPNAAPVTGMLIAANETRAVLSPIVRARLKQERILLWRVRALDANGTVIGESAVREVRMP